MGISKGGFVVYQLETVFSKIILVLALALLVGCAKSETIDLSSEQPNDILQVKADNDVHYEGVDENGIFVTHQIHKDPLSDQYEKGFVKANKLSAQKAILDNGPTSNRVDLVFVGDGYTSSEMAKYETDSQNVLEAYFNQEPLKSYKSYFNVHRIDVISTQSGVDNDPSKGVSKTTALDMNYYCNNVERLLCVNVSKAKKHAANAPQVDQILALANSTKYGGAGYWTDGIATMAAGNSSAIELALHELAHSFAKLGDEYSDAGSSSSQCLGLANGSSITATQMLADKKKWWRWLDLSHINSYEGTCYKASGAFRPTNTSKMRALGQPFYEVNSEEYIFQIYSKVKPIDSGTAAGTYDQNVVLNIKPMQPVGHSLDLRWYLNDVEIANSAQNQNLKVSDLNLASGDYTIKAKVSDLTTRVRDEARRASLMTQTRSWTIKVTGSGPANNAPLAANDSVTTLQDTAVIIDALSNDSDSDGDAISLNSVSAPKLGTATIENQKIKYVPFTGKNGSDSFNYSIKDNRGATSSGKITVNITAVNRAPLANNDLVTTKVNTSVVINVLSNDSDPDGNSISVVTVGAASNGQAVINGSQIVYTPATNFIGVDSFTYRIQDSQGLDAVATVTVEVSDATYLAFGNLDSKSAVSKTKYIVGTTFDLVNTITVSKVSFDAKLQEGFDNIAIYKIGSATPLFITKGSTAAGEYSVKTNVKLSPGNYMVVVLAEEYRKSKVKETQMSSDIRNIKGVRKSAKGVMSYPSSGSSTIYLYGNINLEYKK